MRRTHAFAAIAAAVPMLMIGSISVAEAKKKPPVVAAPPPVAPPVVAPPPTPIPTGFDEANLDRSVNPCDDFYQFSCGGWLKRTEIPADRSRWGSFSEIDERNKLLLKTALEADAAGKGDPADAYRDRLGDFYATCMNEAQLEKTSDAELKVLLAPIDRVKNVGDLAKQVASLYTSVANPIFSLEASQDFKDATQEIATLDQGGISLPDRDYYLKDEGKFKELRQQFEAHVQKMFVLAGETSQQAAADARTVLSIETQLAGPAMSREERRDPNKIYHRINLAGIEKESPKFPWKTYFKQLGHPDITQINVTVPPFFAAMDKMLSSVKMPEWRVYLRWNAIHGAAPYLSKKFVDENFNFFGQALNGMKELPPRWKRCVDTTDHALGEALAQPFVRLTFGPAGKATTQQMVGLVESAMKTDLNELGWMDEPTRKAAQEKLAAIANQIGYPDKWRSYDALKVSRDSYLQNWMSAGAFETNRQLNKIGKPVDRNEWEMTPPMVNAYYNPSLNEMVFPAGILQPPFYNNAARPSVNYGAIGMVMGHELTHGFDDEGRRFDAKGNLREWWTPEVGKEFDRRAECVVKQYDGFVAVDDLHVKGKLTLGENLADLGGMKLAYRAMMLARPQGEKAPPPAAMGGFTDEQLFFLGTAQAWCSKTRPENARVRVTTDPHSPPEFRVNGPMSNLPEFAAAFKCGPDSKMVRKEQCSVW